MATDPRNPVLVAGSMKPSKVEFQPNIDALRSVYRHMFASRRMDVLEESLARRGEAFLFVPCGGHEATAMLAPHLIEADWLHCHYRDKALALARGETIESFFYGLLAKDEAPARGRRMGCFPSNPDLHLLSAPTLVGNNALQCAGVAAAVKNQPGAPIVLCSLGDGSTQEGEVLEAVAEAVRSQLPVLFFVQDNEFALSTRTKGKTFYSLPDGEAESFYGLPVHRVDGTDAVSVYSTCGQLVSEMRTTRGPQILVMKTERLSSHTNADDHTMYRSPEEIEAMKRRSDPVQKLRDRLQEYGVAPAELVALENEIIKEVETALRTARKGTEPVGDSQAKRPLDPLFYDVAKEYRGGATGQSLNMLEAMRDVLKHWLGNDPLVTLFGEDIEDPKGDVFGLTRGLGRAYPNQVMNSPLSESTIVGMSIGRALAGEHPIACLQFADFMPVAL